MKHKFLTKLIITSIAITSLFALVPVGVSAAWLKDYSGNWSYTEAYSYATGWRQISGTWYYFNDIGQMRTGWVQSDGQWYYMDLSGAMQTGVIQIEGKIHLFSQNGAMQRGKCIINGKFYDFDDSGIFVGVDSPIPAKGFDYYGNNTIAYIPSQIISEDASMSSDIPSDGSVQVKQYKVKFKDPDAESDEEELLKTRTIDEDTKMLLYKATKSGYTFVEWNTKSNGDGTSYEYNDTITIKKDITLYAQWKVDNSSTTVDDINVETITILTSNGLNTITTKGGSLQMTTKISPIDATNQKVTWSVSTGTADASDAEGEATINSAGKVTAISNGIVTVKATATDGSGVVEEKTITISGQ